MSAAAAHSPARDQVNHAACSDHCLFTPASAGGHQGRLQRSSSQIMLLQTQAQVPPSLRFRSCRLSTGRRALRAAEERDWGVSRAGGQGWGAGWSWLWALACINQSRFAFMLYDLTFCLTLCLKKRFCMKKKQFGNN